MIEGTRYQSSVDEWATILGALEIQEGDLDVYTEAKMNHNSMANMYNTIPAAYVKTHKLGSIY